MRILLDTNRYSDFARGDHAVVAVLEAAEAIYLPFVVVAEIRQGFLYGSRVKQNEEQLADFVQSPGVGVLFPDETTIRRYSELAVQLRRQGTPIPIHDVWIAALSIQHSLTIYARDKHFRNLPQLGLI